MTVLEKHCFRQLPSAQKRTGDSCRLGMTNLLNAHCHDFERPRIRGGEILAIESRLYVSHTLSLKDKSSVYIYVMPMRESNPILIYTSRIDG